MSNEIQRAFKWLATGNTGISSKTMLFTHFGVEGDYTCHAPSDPSDFNRCLLMLEMVPEVEQSFDKIAKINSEWAAIIKHFQDIKTCFLAEVGRDWCNARSAPKTYKLMKELVANP